MAAADEAGLPVVLGKILHCRQALKMHMDPRALELMLEPEKNGDDSAIAKLYRGAYKYASRNLPSGEQSPPHVLVLLVFCQGISSCMSSTRLLAAFACFLALMCRECRGRFETCW